jgi:hypothetical protein
LNEMGGRLDGDTAQGRMNKNVNILTQHSGTEGGRSAAHGELMGTAVVLWLRPRHSVYRLLTKCC